MTINNQEDHEIFKQLSQWGHQKVVFCHDEDTNLKAIIAIHDTTLGPALGGTRMWPYKTEAEALNDVLRLSKTMTYKAAVAGVNLGGGKAIIIGDSRIHKTEALMRRYARFIQNLNGSFITAEELGTNPRDMEYIRMETQYVTGLPESMGGSGDPSPVTARGVLMGIKACLKQTFGSDSLTGRSVAVQGIGSVGETLVRLLREENAKVYITDINEEQLQKVAKKYGAEVITNHSLFEFEFDVYAPCALGATLNSETIGKLKCSIVAGSANNQLADETLHGKMLLDHDIVYAPDYLINAGGLFSAYSEIAGYSRKRTMQLTENIYNATLEVLKKSKAENITATQAANELAEKRIADIRKIKGSY
ncbi:leucine dehydrogenase [Pedobacter sp. HMF7647]|uniref:Leucine dehydrogenase n=1 Tax=Hufsiella arboris TaxID=2695275 RepID=A0A7K1YD47_9SPHI|nr:Glu/Leu/Phe/Val dehydrogenase [Hufsiella arboris]MXV52495.1 leucine dehydrogenase [Hufsiella arboris]